MLLIEEKELSSEWMRARIGNHHQVRTNVHNERPEKNPTEMGTTWQRETEEEEGGEFLEMLLRFLGMILMMKINGSHLELG